MRARPAVMRLAGPVATGWALGAVLTLGLAIGPAGAPAARACSGPPIPFERVVAHRGSIALVTVMDTAGNPEAPDRYRFIVLEVWRGNLPPLLEMEPPVVHACGDVLAARRGDRLLLALDVRAWDDGAPLTAYWRVGPGDTLEDTMVEDRPAVATLADLKALLAPTGPAEPGEAPEPAGDREDGLALLVGALLVLGAAVLVGVVLVAALARRRDRDERA